MSPSASGPSPAMNAAGAHASSTRGTPFGDALRQWRTLRRLSQLELASRAATPPRHVSFLETGRARPSEAMVQRLAEALDLPPDEHNRLLAVAGFAAAHLARPLSHAALAQVQFVVQRLLASHAPYPALVLDAHYDILDANGAARALFAALGVPLAPAPDAARPEPHDAAGTDIEAPANVIALLLTTLAPLVENHRDVLFDTQRRLRRDLAHRPGDARLAGLLGRVEDRKLPPWTDSVS